MLNVLRRGDFFLLELKTFTIKIIRYFSKFHAIIATMIRQKTPEESRETIWINWRPEEELHS